MCVMERVEATESRGIVVYRVNCVGIERVEGTESRGYSGI